MSSTELTEARLSFLKAHYAKDASDEEFQHFVAVCKTRGLNPELGHVYFMKAKRRDGSLGKAAIVLSIGAYRLIAQRTGFYAGSSAGEIRFGNDGKPLTASVTVKKIVQGQLCEFTAIAYFSEHFRQGSPVWIDMPITMLEKCAEAKALRKAFPEELAGYYLKDELAGDGPIRVEEAPPKALSAEGISSSDPRVLMWLRERLSEAMVPEIHWAGIVKSLDGVGRAELKARLGFEIEKHKALAS